jgi:hypothetical protein
MNSLGYKSILFCLAIVSVCGCSGGAPATNGQRPSLAAGAKPPSMEDEMLKEAEALPQDKRNEWFGAHQNQIDQMRSGNDPALEDRLKAIFPDLEDRK